MANTKLSALIELAAAPATGDEIYIRDISEAAADESKRITWSNLFLNADLPGTLDVTGAVTLDSTLAVADLTTLAVAGNPLIARNTTDAVSNQVMQLSGANPTRADNDEIYQSWMLAGSGGVQFEFARITVVAQDVTAGNEDSEMEFHLVRSGASQRYLLMGSATPGGGARQFHVNPGAIDIDFNVSSNNVNGFLNIDAGLDVMGIGGAAVSGKMLSVYGTLSFPQASTIETTSGDLTLSSAGNEIVLTDQLVLKITDTDGVVEGSVWYDASEDKLKFKTAAGVETITSA